MLAELNIFLLQSLQELKVDIDFMLFKLLKIDEDDFKENKFTSQKISMFSQMSFLISTDSKARNRGSLHTVNDGIKERSKVKKEIELKLNTNEMTLRKESKCKRSNPFEARSKSQCNNHDLFQNLQIKDLNQNSKYIACSQLTNCLPIYAKNDLLIHKNTSFHNQFIEMNKNQLLKRLLKSSNPLGSVSPKTIVQQCKTFI